ncbi:MAG TPA: ATP-binding cassette domain-containing protein [Acidimicrobiales bacterium]|nr:ATP-binding cassette domain-containing protein [Acidimicrobiales bacterium]
MRRDPVRDLLAPTGGALVLFAVLVGGGLLYTMGGGSSREELFTQMLINAIIVLGLQIYIGNTGVLSFGHVAFGGIAGYAFAVLAISPDRKARVIPDAPFGLADVHLDPWLAVLAAVAVTVVVAVIVGLGLARSGASSGAVSATVITLALLFVVHEVAINWTNLTGGDRAGLSFSVGQGLSGRGWIYLALLGAIVLARVFRQTRTGRLAQAAREDDLAARAMGVDPAVQQMIALVLSVAVVAVGASLRVYQLGTITPKFFFFDFTLLTLVMLIVGGRKSITGALTGVVIITVGNELTRYLAGPSVDIAGLGWLLRDGLSSIFLGGAMLGFMILRPSGLLDDLEVDQWALRRWRRRHETRPDPAPPVEPPAPAHLRAESVTVVFGGFRALERAHLDAPNDQITGLIGPNGAGKTTLLNVVTGMVPPTSGHVTLGDQELGGRPAHQIARAGVVRTFQNLRLFPSLTVRENVEVAALVAARHRAGRTRPDVDVLVAQAGLWEHRDRRARELDYGNARRLELARAAALAPEFLLLDEPTSGMSDDESLAMVDRVRETAAAVGAGVVVIDHDLGFITGICDRIYCLDQGSVIAVGTPAEIQADPLVQSAYLGSAAVS